MSCVHHWRLDEPGGGRHFVHGRCTYCGEVRGDFLVAERDEAMEFSVGNNVGTKGYRARAVAAAKAFHAKRAAAS